jgi:hypothetical protein
MFELLAQELPEYTSRLYQRLDSALIVPRAQVSIGNWKPTSNDCHANATTWCTHATGFEIVRGWLFFNMANALPYVLFNAHSVVRNSDGELLDITPSMAADSYPFIIAEENEDAYAKLIESGIVRLRHLM